VLKMTLPNGSGVDTARRGPPTPEAVNWEGKGEFVTVERAGLKAGVARAHTVLRVHRCVTSRDESESW